MFLVIKRNHHSFRISNNVVYANSKASDQPAHMRSLIRAFASRLNILLTEHHLEFLSLKGSLRGSSASTHVKMPHCWKSHAIAQFFTSLWQTVSDKCSESG